MKIKRWQTILIGLVISVGALFLALWQSDWAEILKAFRTARYIYLVPAVLLTSLFLTLRGFRWNLLTQGRLSVVDGFWLFNVGFLFNNILPARMGEIVRAILAGRRPKMHFSSALSSIVVERLFDMVAVAAMVGVTQDLPPLLKIAGAAMGGGALVGIGVLAYAARHPEGALRLGARLMALLPKIDEEKADSFLKPFVEGLGGVSDWRIFVGGLLLSLMSWLGSGIVGWILMYAFWDKPPLIDGMMVIAAAGLGIAIPAAPSGVGPYQAAVIGALVTIGYDPNISRSFAFLLHIMGFAQTTFFGIIGLLREGVSFGEMARAAQSLQEDQTTTDESDITLAEAPSA
jgi:uncharacterized protein (TIRG00374 family)